jgi:hypothetical protein
MLRLLVIFNFSCLVIGCDSTSVADVDNNFVYDNKRNDLMVSLSDFNQYANQLWIDVEESVIAKKNEIKIDNKNGKAKLLLVERDDSSENTFYYLVDGDISGILRVNKMQSNDYEVSLFPGRRDLLPMSVELVIK